MMQKKRPDLMSADFTGGNQAHLAISPLATESHGVLAPLPEASSAVENSPMSPTPTSGPTESRRSPRRDWKPPLEKTDVVGAMEAIEGQFRRWPLADEIDELVAATEKQDETFSNRSSFLSTTRTGVRVPTRRITDELTRRSVFGSNKNQE